MKEWIAALRSGKYKQVKGRLKTDDGFCALGVLRDVQGARWIKDGDDWVTEKGELSIVQDFFPLDALKQEEIMELNDTGHTFDEIADWLEAL